MRVRLHRSEPSPAQAEVDRQLAEIGSAEIEHYLAFCDTRRYSVLASHDPIDGELVDGLGDWRWHISVAGERDVPRWKDLVAIGHELRPEVCFVVGVPPRSWWMSLHPHCLHLWELKDENLTDLWHSERRGSVPS